MRARKKPWAEKEWAEHPRAVHHPEPFKGRWRDYFQNENPIHLELGCGKGRFINGMAAAHPEINYIALERELYVIAPAARGSKTLTGSLGFIIGDVRDVSDYFSQGEISRIYINFCDPWPNKKKWAKRRLTHGAFLDLYKDILTESGEIFFKTDNKALFEFSLNQFCEKGWRLRNISLDLHDGKPTGQPTEDGEAGTEEIVTDIMTEYEEKFSSRGLPIYRCEAYL